MDANSQLHPNKPTTVFPITNVILYIWKSKAYFLNDLSGKDHCLSNGFINQQFQQGGAPSYEWSYKVITSLINGRK